MILGPCVICGLTGYEPSMGGPSICPTCDCGNFGPQLIKRQREEIERLRASQWRLRSAIEFAHSEGFQWPSDPMAEFVDSSNATEKA